MITLAFIPPGKGIPMSPGDCLAVGVLLLILGTAVSAFSLKKRSRAWNGRISRPAQFLYGLSLAIFGATMVANGYFQIPSFAHPFPFFLSAFALSATGTIYDAFNDWRARGFPVRTRCPHCKKGLEFRVCSSHCPHCRKPLPPGILEHRPTSDS